MLMAWFAQCDRNGSVRADWYVMVFEMVSVANANRICILRARTAQRKMQLKEWMPIG